MIKVRDNSFDNLRFFLILLVVVGHLLETVNTGDRYSRGLQSALYFWIYSFHMPAFIFLSGFFAKFKFRKIVKYVVLYIFFQIAYLLFSACILGNPTKFQFTTPYWVLWYIVVMMYCHSLIPLLNYFRPQKIWVISVAIVLSLGGGYVQSIGYPYSLSRFIVFLPFYVIGYYLGRDKNRFKEYITMNKCPLVAAAVGGTVVTVWMFLSDIAPASFLYGAHPYSENNQIMVRIIQLMVATSNIGLLLAIFVLRVNRRITCISYLGQSTISVYLLHGFIVRYLDCFVLNMRLIYVPFWTLVIFIITGNPFVSKLFDVIQLRFPLSLRKAR